MSFRDIIFILIGLALALAITWVLIIRKFFLFINNERDQNESFRNNAVRDYNEASTEVLEGAEVEDGKES